MTVLLLTATAMEQGDLVGGLSQAVRQTVAQRAWTRGLLGGREVQVVETGIGAVNTAHALTRALEVERPALVLQVGVGGAYPGAGLRMGDLAVASEESYGDLGVGAPAGWLPADQIGFPVARVGGQDRYNRFPLDPALVGAAADLLRGSGFDPVAVGPFVTVQECSGTAALARERARRVPGALCESMEGAAAAHVCSLYGVPLVEVRGISNLAQDRDPAAWDLAGASRRAQEAARRLLEGLWS